MTVQHGSDVATAVGFGGKPRRQMVATNWRAREQNTLRGSIDLLEASGQKLHDCMLHEKGATRWIALPSRPVQDSGGKVRIGPDGKRLYVPSVSISEPKDRERFQAQALAALDRLLVEAQP
jgi:hypothetical protein